MSVQRAFVEALTLFSSTDSSLRLWDVKTGGCKQVLKGHQNEKNFVGLATDGNHIVCGSENNQLYVYYKNVSEPLLKYDFTSRQAADSEKNEISLVSAGEGSSTDFVSAVCWKKVSTDCGEPFNQFRHFTELERGRRSQLAGHHAHPAAAVDHLALDGAARDHLPPCGGAVDHLHTS